MYIVDVIPISRGIGKESLSYFTSKSFDVGTIVTVPLRNKKVPALIVDRNPAEEEKITLRGSDFKIKKVLSRVSKTLYTPTFVDTALELSHFFACSTGAVLSALTPKTIITEIEKVTTPHEHQPHKGESEIFVLQGTKEERFANYKSQIRESFAKGASVLFVLPTVRDINNLSQTFNKGIEHYTYFLHSSMKKNEITEQWNKITNETHPVLIVMTGTFLGIPRKDIGTIILENESSSSYKQKTRPFVDIRIASEIYAKNIGANIIFGDIILRAETVWREHTGEAIALSTLKFRSITTSELDILDMRNPSAQPTQTQEKNQNKKHVFKIFSKQVEDLITFSIREHERIFLYGARKGLSPVTVCGDCNTTVTCKRCDSPVVLHIADQTNIFVCHRCGATRKAQELCKTCQSWNLHPLGIGVDRIKEEVLKIAPDAKIFQIDSLNTSTHLKAERAMKAFINTPGSVLIGTQMALDYLPEGAEDISERVENSAVISLDSLFSIPDFRMNEKILHTLAQIRLNTHRNILIQTRLPESPVFDYVLNDNLLNFFKDELDERKRFVYPPFSRFVKITLWGPKARVHKRMEELSDYLADFEPNVIPAFTPSTKGKYGMHLLLKVARENWPNPKIVELLKALPQEYSIDVEPISLL